MMITNRHDNNPNDNMNRNGNAIHDEAALWDKCIAFHGHECGGLLIGFKAALYAIELLGIRFSSDEQLVCISENDACGVDAIQVILGCSIGKGNLLFKLRGKQAYTFYNRRTGDAFRLLLRSAAPPEGTDKLSYMIGHSAVELFEVQPAREELPERARIFQSYPCSVCGEMTAEAHLRLRDGAKICLDCDTPYRRFR